jgi:RNA polymerase sigma-70 factor (ECF subfamily)
MADTPSKMADGASPDVAALYAQYAPGLRRLVVGVLRDRDAADDVVQATFAKATDAAANIAAEAMKSWLYRVAFHEALTWKRRSDVDRKATEKLAFRVRNPDAAGEEALVHRELVEKVRQAMQSLPANQSQVVQARIYQEKTFAQIAKDMGLPLGTVLTHMRRALEKLRRKLKRDDE